MRRKTQQRLMAVAQIVVIVLIAAAGTFYFWRWDRTNREACIPVCAPSEVLQATSTKCSCGRWIER